MKIFVRISSAALMSVLWAALAIAQSMGYAAPPVLNPLPWHAVIVGDSYGFNESTGLTLAQFYPNLVQQSLRGNNVNVVVENQGHSGDTSCNALAVANALSAPLQPAFGGINIGSNDVATTVQASPAPTADTFTVAAGQGLDYEPGCNILVGGVAKIVASVTTDEIVITVPLGAPPAAGASVDNDTTTNIVAIGNRLTTLGYAPLMVGVKHYLNWTSGGDTQSAQSPSQEIIRNKQLAAIVTLNATTVNFYQYMYDLIAAGVVAQGDPVWYVADGNAHLSVQGQRQGLAPAWLVRIPSSYLRLWN